ncbi:MAG: triphosphoribosyl-dephospho-CoA synthase [Candidatus Caldarchaeum sp.]|nr:triphosphoribosyl-dephospho-CoA synthase [Candidatus Caldarchaeum sp.]MCS7138136.1 triphosphoribosyl-dephospho-CoA synthase [Candidatus Caldarchaeum sp.]MDW7977169.1 triphosphoribosyl-dephospho-CoA synthase [Candidatus Caldarchaeum sp.]MDW8359641.1 triphosphoribosyl-dephospho-CoA synthase [Candidatus Caldarchaeum sp.]
MRPLRSPEEVARCCTLGLLLELATTPKPGLVDRTSKTELYPHFTSSATALYRHFRNAAAGRSVGDVVLEACEEMVSVQSGGNTHLGAVLHLTPLAKAAGLCSSFRHLRRKAVEVLWRMDHVETLKLFRAIRSVNPSHLGRVAYLDVHQDRTYRLIEERRLGILQAFKPYEKFEAVAAEYCTGYRNSFVHGYAYLKNQLKHLDINTAGVNTFLNILSHLPDSHVSRMFGRAAARALSRMAGDVLSRGGWQTAGGRAAFERLAEKVGRAGFKPAATADILAVSYTLLLLSGWRP